MIIYKTNLNEHLKKIAQDTLSFKMAIKKLQEQFNATHCWFLKQIDALKTLNLD